MKIDIDKLIKWNALASKHFHKKHTIILPPGEKINFNNALGIEYDKGNWKLEDGLQEYVEILLKQKNLSDEMRVLMIFEKICKDYVYDDNLISYIKKVDDDVFCLPDWYGRDVNQDWERNRKTHNRRICFELSRYLAVAIMQLFEEKENFNVCILWNKDLTHYLVGLASDEYSVTLDTDDFFYIKDLTRIKTGLTAKGITILEDTNEKFANVLTQFNDGRSEYAIEDVETKRMNMANMNNTDKEDEHVLFLKEVMHILEEYNLDSQGIFEYMKEIIDIKLGSETRRKIWKRIDGEDSHRESTRYIRCLIVNINGKEYLVDRDQRIIREFQREEEKDKRGPFIPYSALSRGDYDYYNGKWFKKGCDLMIDLDENYKLIDTLDKRLEQLGDSLWHWYVKTTINFFGKKDSRRFFLDR